MKLSEVKSALGKLETIAFLPVKSIKFFKPIN